ncbi:MAG TPA: hypothetical protein VG893_11565 [Terracidiphilus sp.]|nr:hypothetical protein [Terracidiphilus sp.]
MRRAVGSLLCAWIVALSFSATLLPAQQAPDTFRWIDFHAPADQDIVVWVTRSLATEKWTAIREIGVEYDAALVVTAQRAGPQAQPSTDTFNVWSVSLTNHTVTPLLHGVNLRFLDWMLFAVGAPRELGALYDDCRECNASTYFTAFYYDIRIHGWSARWMRGQQAVPLASASAPAGVTVTNVYALLADPNGHELLATWNHFDYGAQKPAEDYLYQYDVDPWSRVDRTQLLANKEVDEMKHRLCLATDVVSGLEHGQDSVLCQETLHPPPHRRPRAR